MQRHCHDIVYSALWKQNENSVFKWSFHLLKGKKKKLHKPSCPMLK